MGYAAILRQEGGGIARAWKPGAPPASWNTAAASRGAAT
jgi:hypothetical protein